VVQLFYIAIGGALGSVCRFLAATAVNQRYALNGGFPLGTLVVNGAGSFLIGFVFIMLQHHMTGHPAQVTLRSFIMIGMLGGFTTFSTFSLETLQLIESGLWNKALLNIILSLLVCIFAAAAGMAAARLTT